MEQKIDQVYEEIEKKHDQLDQLLEPAKNGDLTNSEEVLEKQKQLNWEIGDLEDLLDILLEELSKLLFKPIALFLLHPEVNYISLITLLSAGNTSIPKFKYSILNDIVTKLNWWSVSAGNKNIYIFRDKLYNIFGTSETLRNDLTIDTEKIKLISEHVPRLLRPANDNELGHYLAGLIDGDGHFSSKQQLIIVFNSLDASLAYYLKEKIGHGNVSKVKNKNAVLLIIASIKGLERVINLINGKIRALNKLKQIYRNILSHHKYREFSKTINLSLNLNNDFKNHWLAGFSDADASFQIKIINRNNRPEIRLNFQIDQKNNDILIEIKNYLGGNIGYRKSQDTYVYNSDSFGSAKKVINYFDRYHLLSLKHIDYLRFRKTYVRLNLAQHLNKESSLLMDRKFNKTMKNLNLSSYNKRNYSTMPESISNVYENSLNKLNPFWLTGFSDGDSTFTVKFKKRSNLTWQISPVFQIGLNIKDKDIIYKIKSFFNEIGIVSFDYENNKVYYTVNKIQDLNSIIIPHFQSYPLLSDKKIDFNLWSEIVKIMESKNHLNPEGFLRILSLKTILNRGLSIKLTEEFPEIVHLSRPVLELSNDVINNYWIAGFTAAEGSFSITINEKDGRKLPQVRARFSIGLHKRDINLLTKIKNKLNIGNISQNNKEIVSYEVGDINDISKTLIPLFDEYNLNNIKYLDFLSFKKVINIIKNKEHLTELGLNKIRLIKSEMNLRRT